MLTRVEDRLAAIGYRPPRVATYRALSPPLELRVDRLEDKLSELEGLPAQVTELGAQITQFRSEMRAEFSATRAKMQADFSAVGEGAVSLAQVREELLAKLEQQISPICGPGGEGLSLVGLRQEIRDGDEETRRLMRVLHEDLVQRIALLGEGKPRRRKTRDESSE